MSSDMRQAPSRSSDLTGRQARLIIENAVDYGIVGLDPDGIITSWSVGAANIMGWSAEEAIGQPGALFFTPEDVDAGIPKREMKAAALDGRGTDERWHLKKDGSRFWANGEVMPLRADEGALEGFVKILRDRTRQRLRQDEYDASEKRKAALLQLSDSLRNMDDLPAMSAIAAETVGRTLGVSAAGLARVEPGDERVIIDRDWATSPAFALIGEYTMRDYGSYIDDLIANRIVVIGDVRSDPRTAAHPEAFDAIGIRALINAPVVEQGRLAALFCVVFDQLRCWSDDEVAFVRDVAERTRIAIERRRAEEGLRNLNAKLESEVEQRTAERDRMWNSSPDLMVVLSPEGNYRRLNPAWKAVLGYDPAELVGAFATDLTHPDDVLATEAALATSQEGELPVFENRLRHKDGSYRWLQWVAAPGPNEIFAAGRHVTEAKEAQHRLEEAESQLRQAQKMEAVGQLTGGLAHDFNNLLTGMMGNLELLQLRVAKGRLDDLDRFINAAQGAGRRAASLTQRLLAFSRRQTLDPKPTDVNRLVLGLEEMLHRTVGATTDIEIVGAAGLWTANIDAGQLENAVLNLCINGRDAMPDGGKLTIETANKWIDDRTGRERELTPGQYISVCVTDTGTGMSPEMIRRAFEPFYTTKPIGQGTGLGLSMIYGFAKQSGGQVRIYSELGQGTTVCIYLPRHHGDADESADEQQRSLQSVGSAQTVLVVDDEATIRHLIDEVLEELGYTVIGAADGASGIKVLQSGAKIELLITDVGLPNGMNGRQVADAARALRPGLKVLFITGFAENAAVGNGHLEPGMELLTKPFTLEALSTKVADMLRS